MGVQPRPQEHALVGAAVCREFRTAAARRDVGLARAETGRVVGDGDGALLGVAAHFTNVVPDLEDDRRTGVRGLPHALGRVWGGVVTFLALVAAAVLAVGWHSGSANAVPWIGFGVTLAIAALGIVLVLTRRPTRWLFRLIIAAALIDVVVLTALGERLLG